MLQRLIDLTLPLRRAAYRLLDRPALRPLLARAVTVYSRVRRGIVVRVRAVDGLWIHEHAGTIVVNRGIETTLPATYDERTRDHFLHGLGLSEGDLVLDVGAGIGTEVLTFARMVGAGGRVIAVEAHPETYRCLERTVELNGLEQVQPVHAAATRRAGPVRITEAADHLESGISAAGEGHQVPGLPLVDLLDTDRPVALLKMNIEGAEFDALHGLGEALTRVDQVAIACHDFLATTADDPRRTLDPVRALLTRAGFTLQTRPQDPRPWVRHTLLGRRTRT